MDYGDLFTRAWRIVWNHKFMFLLAFLATLGATGSFGSNNFSYSFDDVPTDFGVPAEEFFVLFWPFVLGLLCLGIFIALALWLLRLTTQAGMISAASRLDLGEKVTLGEAFGAGTSKLGRMLGINIVMYGPFALLVIIFIAVIVAIAATAITGSALGNVDEMAAALSGLGIFLFCILALICIAIPLLVIISIIYPFAQRAAVLEDMGVIDSIRQGWTTVKKNLANVIILVLFFLVLSLVYGTVLFFILLPLSAIAFGPAVISVIMSGVFGLSDFILLSCGGLILALITAGLNSILIAFRSTTITLAYQNFQLKE